MLHKIYVYTVCIGLFCASTIHSDPIISVFPEKVIRGKFITVFVDHSPDIESVYVSIGTERSEHVIFNEDQQAYIHKIRVPSELSWGEHKVFVEIKEKTGKSLKRQYLFRCINDINESTYFVEQKKSPNPISTKGMILGGLMCIIGGYLSFLKKRKIQKNIVKIIQKVRRLKEWCLERYYQGWYKISSYFETGLVGTVLVNIEYHSRVLRAQLRKKMGKRDSQNKKWRFVAAYIDLIELIIPPLSKTTAFTVNISLESIIAVEHIEKMLGYLDLSYIQKKYLKSEYIFMEITGETSILKEFILINYLFDQDGVLQVKKTAVKHSKSPGQVVNHRS
ncbi:hypothetical protein DID78_01750 [Candidatus Marinamargulisbacteria bacterium SCGC AG-343-D04]|nr:hypothetical protein DID78_01750 [Candidatus Marinamargulisbacteria bacterium SCGC AG-343-D04]